MSDPVRDAQTEEVRVKSYDSELLRARLGPAEAQYGQVIVASLEGNQGPLACGATIVDGDANDTSPSVGTVGGHLVWTDIVGETGYRYQIDVGSTSYLAEDLSGEVLADSTGPVSLSTGFGSNPGSTSHTFRILGHVGHAPNHGSTPIAGDVVSNECVINFVSPGVAGAPTD